MGKTKLINIENINIIEKREEKRREEKEVLS